MNKNMNKMLKQAQKMQRELLKAQEETKNLSITTTSGGGMVKVSMNGNFELTGLKIDPEAVDPSDVEILQDMIVSAINDAKAQLESKSQESMSAITGGMKLPGLM